MYEFFHNGVNILLYIVFIFSAVSTMASDVVSAILNHAESTIILGNDTANHQLTFNMTIPVLLMVTNRSLQPTTTDYLPPRVSNITSSNAMVPLLADTNSTLGVLLTSTSRVMPVRTTKSPREIGAGETIPTATMKSFHPDSHIFVAKANGDADIQALVYVFAVVLFYGLILIIALLGMRARRRHDTRLEDDYAALIDRTGAVRKDRALQQKMNVLRLSNVQHGYMLDQIPEHEVWFRICIINACTVHKGCAFATSLQPPMARAGSPTKAQLMCIWSPQCTGTRS